MTEMELCADYRVYAFNYRRGEARRDRDATEIKAGENLKEKQVVTMTDATERSNKWRVNKNLLDRAIRKIEVNFASAVSLAKW